MSFSERMKEIRLEKEMSQSEFAQFLNTSQACVSAYESGARVANTEMLITIAKKCNVSIDWLLGFSDTKNTERECYTYEDIYKMLTELQATGYFEMRLKDSATEEGKKVLLIRAKDQNIVSFFGKWEELRNSCRNTSHSKKILELFIKNYKEFEE